MKTIYQILMFCVVIALLLTSLVSLHAKPDEKERFEQAVKDAFTSKDADAVMRLYKLDGIHYVFQDLARFGIEGFLESVADEKFVFDSIEWAQVEIKPNEKFERRVQGRKYFYPQAPVAQVIVSFRDKSARGESSASHMNFVGLDSHGKYFFVLQTVSNAGSDADAEK